MFKASGVLVAFVLAAPFGRFEASAADATVFTPHTSCAALLFYTAEDNRGAPTPEAKARLSSIVDMMNPYIQELSPYMASDRLFRQFFASLDAECRQDQNEAMGSAVRAVGNKLVDAANQEMQAAGKPVHLTYPPPG
ncbi:hypothetical protein [Acidomonas methanolica]|uniref:Uncharacterized protein n=1 Tax=Acidomonas methanolica NBRC 104435 TaxID=1231351 RepID=A0A023D8I9_ACIMT|nr:hypothetical protein [Acidomonas methanolica]MBU2652786.1 hypothetical protein [Acidomonas methanolica]MCQ9154991.1 hypothetical protein [Acidomonas methanolica]TCS31189.1 hypothetical protein EDC31_10330 [Acidomonas methanolica]GAJ30458.1 hypothetical protein Amme_138_002 [Acidomonas methanolica NBRC 104435]GBQ49765.1 hypothetical protein AA0498_1064 [Acidomonas methanolica]